MLNVYNQNNTSFLYNICDILLGHTSAFLIMIVLHNLFVFYIILTHSYHTHCRQRAPVENVLSASGTSHLGMIDIQATTKSKYYDHIVLLYLESRRCRHLSIIFVCFYRIPVKCETKSKRNETKRNLPKRNEINRNEIDRNETKRNNSK